MRHGYSKQQQTRLKQLVFECSIARLPASEISKVAYDKLGIQVTENWIGRIRRTLKNDTEKEFKHLLGDSFAYKYEAMQRIKEVKEIQRRKWEIANKEHLTQQDLIRLKCLSELEESTILLCDFYRAIPGIDISFTPTLNVEGEYSPTDEERLLDGRTTNSGHDLSYKTYTTKDGGEYRVYDNRSGLVHPDYRGRYPGDPGYDGNAKF